MLLTEEHTQAIHWEKMSRLCYMFPMFLKQTSACLLHSKAVLLSHVSCKDEAWMVNYLCQGTQVSEHGLG